MKSTFHNDHPVDCTDKYNNTYGRLCCGHTANMNMPDDTMYILFAS